MLIVFGPFIQGLFLASLKKYRETSITHGLELKVQRCWKKGDDKSLWIDPK